MREVQQWLYLVDVAVWMKARQLLQCQVCIRAKLYPRVAQAPDGQTRLAAGFQCHAAGPSDDDQPLRPIYNHHYT